MSIQEQEPSSGAANGFRVLIFDWDGTLVDSIATIVDCTRATLREIGLGKPTESSIRDAIGLGLRETVAKLAPGAGDALADEIISVYRRHWLATYGRRPQLVTGAWATLEQLTAAGYLLAVATAKSRSGLRRDAERLGAADFFCTARTITEAPSKPHPKMILDILEAVDSKAEEALMVGDTTHDLEMARNAGVAAIGVCSGSHPRRRLERARPLECLDSVAELPAWLDARASDRERERR